MEKLLEKLSEHFGYAAPFMYAAAAYGFFHWLDESASDEAKAALARTMSFKDYRTEQIGSALVEVFDQIYTYPLLRWQAFRRVLLFTAIVSGIMAFEFIRKECSILPCDAETYVIFSITVTPFLLLNVISDYLSLFVIRPVLIRSGTKPVISLVLGAASAVAIVLAVNSLRNVLMYEWERAPHYFDAPHYWYENWILRVHPFTLPALAVLVWLPMFALGILTARFLTPLSWIVGRTQWFLKEGKEHPLKAIGYVAAVVVFLGTVAGLVR